MFWWNDTCSFRILLRLLQASLEADCFSYTALTTACARTSQWQKALLLWTEMFQILGSIENFSQVVGGCFGFCMFIDLRMQVESSDISYNAVMSACEKGGQWELSLQLFDDVADSCQITRRRPYVSSCWFLNPAPVEMKWNEDYPICICGSTGFLTTTCGYTDSLELLLPNHHCLSPAVKDSYCPAGNGRNIGSLPSSCLHFLVIWHPAMAPMLLSGGVITLEEWDGYRTWNRKRLNKSQPSTVKSLVTSIMFHCSPMLTPTLRKIIWERLFNRVVEPLRFLGDNHPEIFRSNLVFGLEWEHLRPTRKYLWSCSGCMCSCCEVADGHTVTSSMLHLGRHR